MTDALMRVQSQLPTASGYRTVVQDFEHTQGRPAAVLGPLTALPVDWPARSVAQSSKASDTAYTVSSTNQTKNGGLRFAKRVTQTSRPLTERQAKELRRLAAGLGSGAGATKEILLSTRGQRVRQVWRSGLPWPLLSDNGHTRAELISFDPAQPSDSEEE
ncbi:MAG: hypothetical protein KDA37_13820 [Planctomycetales bacterium]|nr:hypothetical protein [Planctomycetales bacterium]